MSTTTSRAGQLPDGTPIECFTITDGQLEVSLLEYGVRATSIRLRGVDRNLVLGFDTLDEYLRDTSYIGAVVGRYANRIRDGRFILNGETIQLSRNRGNYHLHGGVTGFASRRWQGEATAHGARFSLASRAGEEGYPGNLDVALEVSVAGGAVEYRYAARSDADTIVNLTNHSYFNLDGSADVKGHELQLFADRYLPIDEELLPTGDIESVAGTPFDFRGAKFIGRDIGADDVQLQRGGGYDHCFVVGSAGELEEAARVSAGGVLLSIRTTEPGLQFYSGNQLPERRRALCLETQHFPDSPNHPNFPTTLLRAGETFASMTRYHFEEIS